MIAFFIILSILLIVGLVYRHYRLSDFTLNFHKSIVFTELPIVTLNSNGKSFNFLVDTGSNLSHLKLGVAEQMNSQKIETKMKSSIMTGNGNVEQYGYYDVTFDLSKKVKITQSFEIMDLEETFANWGVEVHGILGVDFLVAHNYKIDFDLFKMYV